jgi:hypothetical protein
LIKVRFMRTSIVACILILLVAASRLQTTAQTAEADASTFKKYPAKIAFTGKPAKPLLVTPLEHTYRTQIREQAQKGPNFAGHYTLAKWGCGSPCVEFVIIDAKSGAVYDPGEQVGCANRNGMEARLQFRLDSQLIAATGSSGINASSKEVECGTNYYRWDGKRINLVHFEPWPKSGSQN